MKTSFIVIALADGKFVVPPMMIAAEDHVVAINIAGACLAETLDAIPANTVLHSFDTETDVTYVGDQCTDSVESEESVVSILDRVYRPDELIFAVIQYPEGAEGSFVVRLNVREYWMKHHGVFTELSSENLELEVLESTGLLELGASLFEFTVENCTESEVVGRLIEAGFGYSDSFVKFVQS